VAQILDQPAHHAMDRRDRPSFDDRHQSRALRRAELGWIARRLAVNQPYRARPIETQDPIPDRLKLPRANPRRAHGDLPERCTTIDSEIAPPEYLKMSFN
jgi:hypothetical protein